MLSRPALLAYSLSFSSPPRPPPNTFFPPLTLFLLPRHRYHYQIVQSSWLPMLHYSYYCVQIWSRPCSSAPINIPQKFLPYPLTTYSHILKWTIFMISLFRRCSLRHNENQYKSLLLVNGLMLKNMLWSILYKIQWALWKYAIVIFRSGLFASKHATCIVYRINIIKGSSVV